MLSLIKFPDVFHKQQVPEVFHERGIMSGYRNPRSSATDCILSLFQMTNETLNIWTHFLPTWYFLWKLMTVVLMQSAWRDPFTWPLLIFLVSCCMYPLASSCAHTFSSMSPRARHICFFFDYAALSFYSLGSAFVYSAYSFPEKWVKSSFHEWFISIAVVNTIICTILACYSRLGLPFLHYSHGVPKRFHEWKSPKFSKYFRILAFGYPYLFDQIPLFYRVFWCAGDPGDDGAVLHYRHIALAFLTGFLFASHLPERLAPGSFDYIGHSHQLFHVCSILGTHFQMLAAEQDMSNRRVWLSGSSIPITFSNSVALALLCVGVNLIIIFLFSLPLLWAPAFQKGKHRKHPKGASDKLCCCD